MSTIGQLPASNGLADGQTAASQRVIRPADHDLTVIIPAHNEEKRLPWTLAQLDLFLRSWGVDFRVVVADDGSNDRTAGLADRLGPCYSTMRLSRHAGKGRAVREAMLRATGRVTAFTDADLPFRLDALQQGYEWIRRDQCEAVFGARDIAGSQNLAPRRLLRRAATFAFRELVRGMVSAEVTDTQCGLKLFSRRAALEIFARATIDGFAFDAEVVLLTHRLGLPFRRVPVTLVNEFSSTLSLRRNALPMLWDVFRLRWRDRSGRTAETPQFVFAEVDGAPEDERQKVAA
jgi:dolichyl-phosphate beta-glucosyltransferase